MNQKRIVCIGDLDLIKKENKKSMNGCFQRKGCSLTQFTTNFCITWSRHEATTDRALSHGPSTVDCTSLGSIISLTAIDFNNSELSEGRRRKCPWGEALTVFWRPCDVALWPLVFANRDTPLMKNDCNFYFSQNNFHSFWSFTTIAMKRK